MIVSLLVPNWSRILPFWLFGPACAWVYLDFSLHQFSSQNSSLLYKKRNNKYGWLIKGVTNLGNDMDILTARTNNWFPQRRRRIFSIISIGNYEFPLTFCLGKRRVVWHSNRAKRRVVWRAVAWVERVSISKMTPCFRDGPSPKYNKSPRESNTYLPEVFN